MSGQCSSDDVIILARDYSGKALTAGSAGLLCVVRCLDGRGKMLTGDWQDASVSCRGPALQFSGQLSFAGL